MTRAGFWEAPGLGGGRPDELGTIRAGFWEAPGLGGGRPDELGTIRAGWGVGPAGFQEALDLDGPDCVA
jgi:hypothetical protein